MSLLSILGSPITKKLLKAGAWGAAGSLGANWLNEQASQAKSPAARLGLNVAALAATYKGYQGGLQNIVGAGGAIARKVSGTPRGFIGPMNKYVGGLENAESKIAEWGLLGLGGKSAKLAGSIAVGTPKFLVSPVTGAVEYGAAFAKSVGRGPGSFMAAMTQIKSPDAPFIALGLGMGGLSAYQQRSGSHRGFVSQPSPLPYGYGHQRPTNQENFGGGIAMGRSAIRSATVMGGQASVTNRMLNKRRV